MISTATALTSASARRGSGPHRLQATNASTATRTTAGTKQRGDAIGEPLNRRAAALRLADHPHDLREQRVGADAIRADERGCRSC